MVRTGRSLVVKRLGAVILGILSISVSVVTFGYGALLVGVPGIVAVSGVVIGIVVLLMSGLINVQRQPKITPLPSMVPTPLGIRIVQITDIHLDGITPLRWVRGLVNTVNELKPDILVFTGDLLDINPNQIPDQIQLLSTLTATHAKLAVSGNHDYYLPYPLFQAVIRDIGFELIDNRHIHIAGIDFVGLPDPDSSRFGFQNLNPPEIWGTMISHHAMIVLSHRPDPFPIVARLGATIQLSGHTHWGQIPPFGLITRVWHRFSRGLGQIGQSWIYVSKGTGVWGPPIRLFGRSEIVVLDI